MRPHANPAAEKSSSRSADMEACSLATRTVANRFSARYDNRMASRSAQIVEGVASHPILVGPDGSRSPLPFYTDFQAGLSVLDVGCGTGVHLRQLSAQGCHAVGVESDPQLVEALQREGLSVVMGRAESLPFPA